jgi:hypothetical protein
MRKESLLLILEEEYQAKITDINKLNTAVQKAREPVSTLLRSFKESLISPSLNISLVRSCSGLKKETEKIQAEISPYDYSQYEVNYIHMPMVGETILADNLRDNIRKLELPDAQHLLTEEVEITRSPIGKFPAPSVELSKPPYYTCNLLIHVVELPADKINLIWNETNGNVHGLKLAGKSGETRGQLIFTMSPNSTHCTNFRASEGSKFALTWIVNGTLLTVYINGILDFHTTIFANLQWPGDDWRWGEFFLGGRVIVKEIKWWNRSLSENEIVYHSSFK